MEDKRKIKRNTLIIVVSVVVLTIASLNFSYSAFFTISSNGVAKEISTGTLDVTADATLMKKDDMFPIKEENLPTEAEPSKAGSSTTIDPGDNYSTLTITNNGTIDANYVVSLSYDLSGLSDEQKANDLASFDNLIIGIYDEGTGKWLDLNPDAAGQAYNMRVKEFGSTGVHPNQVYPILKGEIAKANIDTSSTAPTTKTLRVYVWLAEDTPVGEIGKLVHLKLDVKSTPVEGQEVS